MSPQDEARSLGEALPREMARVRDKVLPYYTPDVNGQFAAALMRSALDEAATALASGDVFKMIASYEALKGFTV